MLASALLAFIPLALAKPVTAITSAVTVFPTATSTSMSPFATTTDWPGVPKGAIYSDPPAAEGRGRRIHPLGRSDLCVTVQPEDNEVKSGAAVEIPYVEFQLWTLFGDVQFVDKYITLGNSSRALDAVNGKLVLNEVGIHDQGQKWSYSPKGYYAVDGKCLTFVENSKADAILPWGKVRDLTASECIGGAANQVFYLLPLEQEL